MFKLEKGDKDLLLSWGYAEADFLQIAEKADEYSYQMSGFKGGHDIVVKVDGGFMLVPVSEYSGWTDYNALYHRMFAEKGMEGAVNVLQS